MVLNGGPGRFTDQIPQFFGLQNGDPITEREQPANVPIPIAPFDGKCDTLMSPFFLQKLEWRLLSDALSRDRVRADRSPGGHGLIVPVPNKIGQRKFFMRFELFG